MEVITQATKGFNSTGSAHLAPTGRVSHKFLFFSTCRCKTRECTRPVCGRGMSDRDIKKILDWKERMIGSDIKHSKFMLDKLMVR